MTGADSGPMFRWARVFFPVFVLASAACLAYVFARPPVYVSTARVRVELPPAQPQAAVGDASSNLLKTAQALTGNAMLESVSQRVGGPSVVGPDALRGMLSVEPVPVAGAIELRAEGSERELLPRILTAWIEAWRQSLVSQAGQVGPQEPRDTAAPEEARGAVAKLAEDVAARRGEVERFRAKYDIESLARGEGEEAARLKGLDDAMNEARSREAAAAARVNAIRESAAAGRVVPGTVETPAVGALEKQAADVRQMMKNLEQDYTPLYLGHDPRYKEMRVELARVEQRLEQEKRSGAQQALQKAEEEAAVARQTVARLQEELAAGKLAAQEFTARVSEHSALTAELARVEEAYAAAQERFAQLEKEKESKAASLKLTVLERPLVPERPDRPHYWRDALLGLAGSAALGFMAAWLVGFFRRPEPRQPVFAVYPGTRPADPPGMAGDSAYSTTLPAQDAAAAWLPGTIARFSRELSGSEVHALWRAAAPEARIVIAGLLGGLSLEELAALRYGHVDLEACYVRVPGISERTCTLRDPLRRLLIAQRAAKGGAAPLADAGGEPLGRADLEALIAGAAHDAGLEDAGEVTAEMLRHTYFAYLVRQGARLAEIGEFIGRIPPAAFREYGPLSPPGAGLPMEEIDPVFPALRAPPV